MTYKHRLKDIFFIFIIFIKVILIKCDEKCQDEDIFIYQFWNKLNNIKHGDVIIINLKNYYCPACNQYLSLWEDIKSNIYNIEKSSILFLTFDCICPSISKYCNYFDVRYYPTFRLIFPVYKHMKSTEYSYISTNNMIADQRYKGELLLAYTEVYRTRNMYEFQKLIQEYLCDNMEFNHVNLKLCVSYILNNKEEYNIHENSLVRNNDAIHIEKWGKNSNKNDIKHDIIIGILFTLKVGISMGGSEVNYSHVETFIEILQIVSLLFDDLTQPINDISRTLKEYSYPISRDDWIKSTSVFKIFDYQLDKYNNTNFKFCEKNSLLCAFWLLYHKISIYCLQHDNKRYSYYITLINNYTKKYLNCKNCIHHFMNAQKNCYYGFCNIYSAESYVIFLWRIHNGVTLRSTYENIMIEIELGNKNWEKNKFLNNDIAFPSKRQCLNCRNEIGFTKITKSVIKDLMHMSPDDQFFDVIDAYSISHILRFLTDFYS